MPEFAIVSLEEARRRIATSRRGHYFAEYGEYIQQLDGDQAGTLVATEGESVLTIRRRLAAAADILGKNLVIKRTGDELYFWLEPSAEPTEEERPRRRYRRPAQAAEESNTGEQVPPIEAP